MRTAICFCSCLLLLGCATDDSSAPVISNLTYTPSSLTVGQQTTISGTLGFDDSDGNLAQLDAEVVMPDQTRHSLPMTGLQHVGDMTNGVINWAMIIVPPVAGSYELSLWIMDADGNASNRLDGTATATP